MSPTTSCNTDRVGKSRHPRLPAARGQLGTELQHQLSAQAATSARCPSACARPPLSRWDVHQLDITDREATINDIRRHQPDTVINCAAFTNVDGCETARATRPLRSTPSAAQSTLACEKVSALDPHFHRRTLPRHRQRRCRTGRVRRARADSTAYGQTKLLGEQYVERFCRRHFIVRTAWLYSSYGKNFVKTMIVWAVTKRSPSSTTSWATPPRPWTWPTISQSWQSAHDHGIYHCTGSGICSWYDFRLRHHAACPGLPRTRSSP